MKTGTIVLIGIGTLGVGAIAYFAFFRNQGNPVIAGPNQIGSPVNQGLLTQPSQAYPVTGPTPTRQDTASQPWYGGTRPQDATAGLVDQNLLKNVQLAQGASSIVSSVKSIWDDLDISSWWSGTSAPIEEENSFASSNFTWNSYLGGF